MSAYTAPKWSHAPPPEYAWTVDEIKGGIQVDSYTLSKRSTTFGRAADSVDIPTAHESCSRLHARIAFDKQGTPWLRDLGSGHGTKVNKRPLPKKSVGKNEDGVGEGSRGVMLFPGDVVQFGASTRMYCIVGPAEFERGALKARPQQAKAAQASTSTSVLQQNDSSMSKKQEEGVSWGMDMDEETDDKNATSHEQAAPAPQASLDYADIPDRHRKTFEKIMAKKYKLENLMRESGRIQQKGGIDDLTAGQRAQLEKNKVREEALQQEIEEMELSLNEKIHGKTEKARDDPPNQNMDEEEDDETFYDKTARSSQQWAPQGETEESLTAKWKSIILMIKKYSTEQARAGEAMGILEARISKGLEADEDAFFLQNDLDLAKEKFHKIEELKKEAEKEIDEVEQLLKIVNNKILIDREAGHVGKKLVMLPPPAITESREGRVSAVEERAVVKVENMMPPAPRPGTMSPPGSTNAREAGTDSDGLSLQNSQPKQTTGSLPIEGEASSMPPPPAKRHRGPSMPPRSTLSAIRMGVSLDSSNEKQGDKALGETGKVTHGLADPKKDVWRAPEGQDGSGFTSLNAKFKGRY